MNIIVIGGKALNNHIPTRIQGNDTDYIMTYADYKIWLDAVKECENIKSVYPISNGKKMVVKCEGNIYEIEIAWPGSSAESFMLLVTNSQESSYIDGLIYPELDALYAMKMSHRYLRNSPHFMKTRNDIMIIRKFLFGDIKEHKVSDYFSTWYETRMNETYYYKHPNLDTVKNDFFKDESFYKYDHDDLHLAVALEHHPAYMDILDKGAQVKCSKENFMQLNEYGRMKCGLEESYVLALERSLIPNGFKPDAYGAIRIALMKVCTSITSGWFREWCWENYDLIEKHIDSVFLVNRFNAALARGELRPFKYDLNCSINNY